MSDKNDKTNVMRILDQKKISYNAYSYEKTEEMDGEGVAAAIGKPPERVFKTLVTVGASKSNYVFVIPVNRELDLKKAATAVGEKNIEMIKSKELLPLTGYIHGGCSPIGMKKFFRTTIDKSAENYEEILFSAGRVGRQVEVKLCDLEKVIKYGFSDLTR
ncbi:MAG: Cys-tRNA(Pro) deacylase [Ruminococcaceae bacterium]|nr:Cys-tRNA(Pro) deacylase [Oscillospiraceae bacterium]